MSGDGFDLGSRRALVMATSRYEHAAFSRLRSPSSDAEQLTDVLEDDAIGGYNVRQLLDQADYILRMQIEDFFADAETGDLLLLYLSCHGVKDQAGQLHFATVNTRPNRLASTSVPAEFIYQQVDRCRSRKIILILDCCYSGAYAKGRRPRAGYDTAPDLLGGRGWAVMTSSTALEYAFEPETGKLSWAQPTAPSFFTAAVVEGLRTGRADLNRDGLISFDELYEYVLASVRRQTPFQTPEKKWGDVRGDIIVARNPQPCVEGQAELDKLPDRAFIQVSRRNALIGLAAAAAAAGISAAGWELARGGRGTKIWEFTTTNSLASSPLVNGGTVYAVNTDGNVYALRAAEGTRIWEYSAGLGVPSNLVVQGGAVYGYTGTGRVYALDASNGHLLWSFPNAGGDPAVADGVVCVPGTAGSVVYGLSAGTGTRLWHAEISGYASLAPMIVNSIAYVGSGGDKVTALDISDGSVVWRSRVGAGGMRWLGVVGNAVYVASDDGFLYVLDTGDGRHSQSVNIDPSNDPVVVGGIIYVESNGYLNAFSSRRGTKLWESPIGAGFTAAAEPLISRYCAYIGGSENSLYAIWTENGVRKWKFSTGGSITSSPVTAGGCLYFGSNDHGVYALRSRDGAKIWSFTTGAQVSVSPAIANAIVYACSGDGIIYALRA